jgi:hypothetical protein
LLYNPPGSTSKNTALYWARRNQRHRGFFKWYLFSGAWRKGKVGVATGLYATAYSFLKYFKSWYQHQEKESVANEQTDSQIAK